LFSGNDVGRNDYIIVGATIGSETQSSRILVTTSDTAGIGSSIVAYSAGAYRVAKWVALPL
jgi:hypothetical protein